MRRISRDLVQRGILLRYLCCIEGLMAVYSTQEMRIFKLQRISRLRYAENINIIEEN